MNHAFRLKMAKQQAEAFLKESGIDQLPVDPIAIAESHDIVVEPKADAAPGVSGMLLRYGNAFGILYATYVASEGFQRFSVGHELGHYFLDGHIDHVLKDGIHASYAGFVSADPYELEADSFAAGLLMPASPFQRALRGRAPGLSTVESVAGLCRTSLTATAIRYAELSGDAVAVVVSTGATVDFCRLSDGMKSLRELTWLKKGSPVPADTATGRFNRDVRRVAAADRLDADIDVMNWLGGVRSVRATEEVIGLGSYGKTLTVLTCPSLEDETFRDEDDEDEATVIDRWTPRFRR